MVGVRSSKGVFLIIFSILFLFPLVNAQPPFQQTTILDKGIQIEVTLIDTIEQNKLFQFHIHAHNSSNGLLLKNDTIDFCAIHLFNNSGKHIVLTNMTYDKDHLGWEFNVLGGNFSKIGFYDSLFYCEVTGEIGGFFEHIFEVTKNGDVLDTPKTIVYLILVMGALFFFLLCLYGGIVLPFKNKRNEASKIIAIERLKYFKLALLFLSYILFVWIANLLFALANNFDILTSYIAFFEIMFKVINSFSLAVFVIMWVSMMFLAWRDLNLKRLLSRGINPK